MVTEYDYIIAGAGSAGCTLAARLAEDKDVSVLLVEAGGSGKSLFTRMPAGNGFVHGNPQFDWAFESVPQPGLNGRKIYYPRGKGVGGSSLMNGMIYVRGHPADYDGWRQKGLTGWSYADVLPYFRKSFSAAHRKGDAYHGTDGPVKLSPAGNYDRINELFVEACIQAGAPPNDDFNGARQEGAGRLDTKVWKGRRQSSAECYLRSTPGNLTVQTDEHVLKVLFQGTRAVGLLLASGEVRAEREVILSMGSFGTPQCLMLSGVGPADHLREHGIDVVADVPGVGSNLHDHPNMPMQYGLSDPSMSLSRFQRLDRAVLMGAQYLLSGTGAGAGPFWSAMLFHALRDRGFPELEVFFTPMVVVEEFGDKGWTIQNVLNMGKSVIARGKTAAPGLQLDINILRPRSHGTVGLASADPYGAPLIDPKYMDDPADIADLREGVRHMREVMRQPALEGIATDELSPGLSVETDDEIDEAIRNLATTGHHPVCTCRMGPDHDKDAVLDESLRVRGFEALRVVDGSAFPTQINGNINAPIIMMAEKAADMILQRQPLPPEHPRSPS